MSKLPRLTGKEVVRSLERHGFQVIRARGSHHFLRHPDGRQTVVPIHGNDTLGPGLLSKIIRDSGIDFRERENEPNRG